MTRCKCGSNEFFVKETIWNSGTLDLETGKLAVKSGETDGFEKVICAKCDEKIKMDDIEFDIIEFDICD